MEVGIKVGAPIEPVTWHGTRELALAAEAAGFHSVWVEDHHIEPNGGPLDAWTAMAALAAITARVRIGPVVASLNFERSPVVLAHRIATLHEISAGRLIMGVGSGDPGEHEMVGLASEQPVARFIEVFEVVRRLLSGERFRYDGAHIRLEDAFLPATHPVEWRKGMPSAGPTDPRAVEWMTGSTRPRMLDATLPHASGWTTHWSDEAFLNDPARFPHLSTMVDERLEALGREPAEVWRATEVWVQGTGAIGLPIPVPDGLRHGGGSVDAMTDYLGRCEEAGIDHLIVLLDPQSPAAVEELAEARARR